MANSHAALDAHIRKLRELGQLAERAAPKIARAVEDELGDNIERGVGPDGKAWPATEDGRKPLQNAADALTVRAAGTTIVGRVTGVEARHDRGWVKGGKKRPILPTGELPDPLADAIGRVVDEEFERTMEKR